MVDTNEIKPSRHNRNDVHMNSEKLWQQAQGLHSSKTDDVSVLRGEVDINSHP